METNNLETGRINIFGALPHQKDLLIGSVNSIAEAKRIKAEWNNIFKREGIIAYCCANKQYNQERNKL